MTPFELGVWKRVNVLHGFHHFICLQIREYLGGIRPFFEYLACRAQF